MRKYNGVYKNDWLEFSPTFADFNLSISQGSYFDQRWQVHICLFWGNLFISLPIKTKKKETHDPPEWGICYHSEGNCLMLDWGRKTKIIDMPWALQWYRRSEFAKYLGWEHNYTKKSKHYSDKQIDFCSESWEKYKYKEAYVFYHKDSNSSVTISMWKNEWRPKWFMWTARFAVIRKFIEVEFHPAFENNKGDTFSIGFEMLKHETSEEAWYRMEKTFNFEKYYDRLF